jgi:hypothetical protein
MTTMRPTRSSLANDADRALAVSPFTVRSTTR